MEDNFMDYCSSQELARGADAFICAECGEGFIHYTKLVRHMSSHESAEAFPSEAGHVGNGLEAPVVFALQKNGTFTVVEKPEVSDSSSGKKSGQFDAQPTSVTRSSEKASKPCSCERCGQTFSNQLSLRHHQQYHSLGQHFKCTLCCKVHKDRDSLREHLQIHVHERFYSCGHCGKRFLKRETLSAHHKQWHSSQARKEAKSQENGQENGQFYQCKLCDLHFYWLSDLQSHLMSHSLEKNGVGDKPEPVTKKTVLHPKHGGGQLYHCDVCGKGFRVLEDLKQHHWSHQEEQEEDTNAKTPRATEKKVLNSKGSRLFKSRKYNNAKRRMHSKKRGSSTRMFPCKHCNRVFVHSSSLSRHNRYHKGTMHTCRYCGRHFPQRCDVTRHIALYHQSELRVKADRNGEDEDSAGDDTSVEQPKENSGTERSGVPKACLSFKCRECGKVFGLLSVYKRHQRYHRIESNRQMHKCSKCRCRFSQLSALERHLKTHKDASSDVEKGSPGTADTSKGAGLDSEDSDVDDSGIVKPALLYECTVCGESYASMQTFMKHQAEHG